MKIRCIVVCRNANGEPDFFCCFVECTEIQYDDGEHYEAAKDLAILERYEEPFVVFDENDGPRWFFGSFDWESGGAPTTVARIS